jgi:hypothetical protein
MKSCFEDLRSKTFQWGKKGLWTKKTRFHFWKHCLVLQSLENREVNENSSIKSHKSRGEREIFLQSLENREVNENSSIKSHKSRREREFFS